MIDPKYTQLPEQFSTHGREMTLVHRTECAALYRATLAESSFYEVWRRSFVDASEKRMPGDKLVQFDAREVCPSARDFGNWAWTYKSLPLALQRFAEIDPDAQLDDVHLSLGTPNAAVVL